MELDTIVVGDCLDVMAEMPDGCVDLVIADPPHNKGLVGWDRNHDWKPWIPEVLRVLKLNGALWIDHSDISEIMAISEHIVECGGPERLNFIVWDKFNVPLKDRWAFNGIWESPSLRSWPQMAEYLIYHASEKSWKQQLDPLRGFVFEPLRAYLDGERKRAGINFEQVRQMVGCANGSGLPSHWFTKSQWMLPTSENFIKLCKGFNKQGRLPAPPYEDYHAAPRSRFECDHSEREYLRVEYENLRVEYENLRAEYENLRYTFNGPPGCGSVWPIPAWNHEADWHPTPKPLALLGRILSITSNEGDIVFDPFMGSGTTAVAALKLGRHFYGCDISPEYVKLANKRIAKTRLEMSQMEMELKQ